MDGRFLTKISNKNGIHGYENYLVFSSKRRHQQLTIYWNNRIGNSKYSKKIRNLTNAYLALLQQYPRLGKQTENPLIRFIVIRDYKLFYCIKEDTIYIIRFWDTRQNPKKLS